MCFVLRTMRGQKIPTSLLASDGVENTNNRIRGALMTKCLICEQRPARIRGLCHNCQSHIDKDTRIRNGNGAKPKYYLTYRGHVVGLYPEKGGTLKARLEPKKTAARLPKKITINLDTYCDGYDREQIKRFKACVLRVAHA